MKQAFTFVALLLATGVFSQSLIERAVFSKFRADGQVEICKFEIEPGGSGRLYVTLNGIFIPYSITNTKYFPGGKTLICGDIYVECLLVPGTKKPRQVSVYRRGERRKTIYFN